MCGDDCCLFATLNLSAHGGTWRLRVCIAASCHNQSAPMCASQRFSTAGISQVIDDSHKHVASPPICRAGEKRKSLPGCCSLTVSGEAQHIRPAAGAPQMYFTIDWPHNHIFGAEHLKLAFEDVAEAESWHQHLQRAIGEHIISPMLNSNRDASTLTK